MVSNLAWGQLLVKPTRGPGRRTSIGLKQQPWHADPASTRALPGPPEITSSYSRSVCKPTLKTTWHMCRMPLHAILSHVVDPSVCALLYTFLYLFIGLGAARVCLVRTQSIGEGRLHRFQGSICHQICSSTLGLRTWDCGNRPGTQSTTIDLCNLQPRVFTSITIDKGGWHQRGLHWPTGRRDTERFAT